MTDSREEHETVGAASTPKPERLPYVRPQLDRLGRIEPELQLGTPPAPP